MDKEVTEKLKNVGEMKKRRVKMEDGRRYLIYYTFKMSEPLDEKMMSKELVFHSSLN